MQPKSPPHRRRRRARSRCTESNSYCTLFALLIVRHLLHYAPSCTLNITGTQEPCVTPSLLLQPTVVNLCVVDPGVFFYILLMHFWLTRTSSPVDTMEPLCTSSRTRITLLPQHVDIPLKVSQTHIQYRYLIPYVSVYFLVPNGILLLLSLVFSPAIRTRQCLFSLSGKKEHARLTF